MYTLKLFNKEDIKEQYNFVKDFKSSNGFINEYYNMSESEFLKMVDVRNDHRNGKNLPNGFVPCSQYFLWKEDKIVAVVNIRHCLNDFLKTGPGHIGFAVKESGNGYATIALELAIKEVKNIKDFKDDEIYLSCNINNLASLKVQIKNNARVVDITEDHFLTRIKL